MANFVRLKETGTNAANMSGNEVVVNLDHVTKISPQGEKKSLLLLHDVPDVLSVDHNLEELRGIINNSTAVAWAKPV